jgi:hypothetical protein
MSIDSVVSVNISRQTTAVAQQDLSVVNILSTDCKFQDLIRFYTDLTILAGDLIGGVASMTYRMAQKLFAQAPRVARFAVSNWGSKRAICFDNGTYTAGSISVTINGTVYTQTYSSTKAGTLSALNTLLDNISDIASTSLSYGASGIILTLTRDAGPLCVTVDDSGVTGTMTADIVQMGTIVDNGGTYTAGGMGVSVNGAETTVAYNTSKAQTLTDIAAAIATNGGTNIISSVSSSATITWYAGIGKTAVILLDPAVVVGTMLIGEAAFTAQSPSTTLDAVKLVSNAWYGLLDTAGIFPLTAITANQKLIAAWAETNLKFYGASSSDAITVNTAAASDTTSLAYYFKAQAYTRSFVAYSASADTSFPAAALLGKIMPLKPGSYTAKFKTLTGVIADALTPTQETNALAKNAMIYTTIGGIDMTSEGKVASGEWIDTIIGIDWMTGLIQTNVFAVEVNNPKVPYDDRGISAIGEAVGLALSQGLPSGNYPGLFTPMMRDKDGNIIGGYVITLPKASAVTANDKNLRVLNNVQFTAFLSGAIHSMVISGVVTV